MAKIKNIITVYPSWNSASTLYWFDLIYLIFGPDTRHYHVEVTLLMPYKHDLEKDGEFKMNFQNQVCGML